MAFEKKLWIDTVLQISFYMGSRIIGCWADPESTYFGKEKFSKYIELVWPWHSLAHCKYNFLFCLLSVVFAVILYGHNGKNLFSSLDFWVLKGRDYNLGSRQHLFAMPDIEKAQQIFVEWVVGTFWYNMFPFYLGHLRDSVTNWIE